jgi:site-specific recombinase XerC
VGWDHDLLNPFFDTFVDLMPWPRRLFTVSAPSQVHLDNTAIIKLKQCIVCSGGMCNGSQLHSVQWHLRKVMLEELQRRNFSQATIRAYIGAVERFARFFGKPPDQLGPEHIREYQAHLLHKKKLKPNTVVGQVAALRFFFARTLKRRFPPDSIPYPKYTHDRVPRILSPEEVAQLIDAASNLQARAILMLLYSTGIRRS